MLIFEVHLQPVVHRRIGGLEILETELTLGYSKDDSVIVGEKI